MCTTAKSKTKLLAGEKCPCRRWSNIISCTSRSYILPTNESKEIGLKFLTNKVSLDFCSADVNSEPWRFSRQLEPPPKTVNGDITTAHCFSMTVEIPSGPVAFLAGRHDFTCTTSISVHFSSDSSLMLSCLVTGAVTV